MFDSLVRRVSVGLMLAALTVGLLPGSGWSRAVAAGSESALESAVVTEQAITYREVDGETLLLDACLPSDVSEPLAAVVLVHGGGWTGGQRDAPQWASLCDDLAGQGYAAFTVDYRLAPDYPFPAAFEDVRAAVEWLGEPEQVDRFGIDPDRLGILGGSAGGNLAGLVGTAGDGDLADGARVRAVVSLSGPMILTEDVIGSATSRQIETALTFLDCDIIDDCPAAEAASPISAVDSTDPPFLLIHAEDAPVVPVDQSVVMGEALDSADVPNEVVVVPGTAHAARLLDDDRLSDTVFTFLDDNLAS